jgi:hypothetical protein
MQQVFALVAVAAACTLTSSGPLHVGAVAPIQMSDGANFCSTPDSVLLEANFNNRQPGEKYQAFMVGEDFGYRTPFTNGLNEGRAEIRDRGNGDRSLHVRYPGGKIGSGDSGAQFQVIFEHGYEELVLSYDVMFANGFSWTRGGKLPGLAGGVAPTNGNGDTSGFSARLMWRENGAANQYIYYPDNGSTWGEYHPYNVNFQAGKWHHVQNRIRMNGNGISGVMEAWLDGQRVIYDTNFPWRGGQYYDGINMLYFSTFFGGNTGDWAPGGDQEAEFDNFVICSPSGPPADVPQQQVETAAVADQSSQVDFGMNPVPAQVENNPECGVTWAQCGGIYHHGPWCCQSDAHCVEYNQWYSQCHPW